MKLFSKNVSRLLYELCEIIFISIAVAALTYIFAGQFLEVSGDSMKPTLADKEQILAEKLSIKYQGLKRGDIAIFYSPEQPDKLIVKRIVGLSGETIKISNGIVFINDNPINEAYIDKSQVTLGKGSIVQDTNYVIPNDKYVVLGDNRQHSIDSRDWGMLEKNKILGKALLVYSPIKNFRFLFQSR